MADPVPAVIFTRWNESTRRIANAYLADCKEKPFPDLADGNIDLRGVTITEFIKNSRLSQINLSDAVAEDFGQFGFCKVDNCCFRNASLETNLGNEFSHCDFKKCKLSGTVLRGEFRDCDFEQSNLTGAKAEQSKFLRCRFIKANLRKAMLSNCFFEDCTFDQCTFGSGSVAGSQFVRCGLDVQSLPKTNIENTRITE